MDLNDLFGHIQFQPCAFDVDDPQSSIESFVSQFKLSRREAQAAQEAWELEQGHNLFHVVNAFTRGRTGQVPQRRRELQAGAYSWDSYGRGQNKSGNSLNSNP